MQLHDQVSCVWVKRNFFNDGENDDDGYDGRDDDGDTWVVDFKTGYPMSCYDNQIQRYVDVIKAMGYPNVRGEVVYCWWKTVKKMIKRELF